MRLNGKTLLVVALLLTGACGGKTGLIEPATDTSANPEDAQGDLVSSDGVLSEDAVPEDAQSLCPSDQGVPNLAGKPLFSLEDQASSCTLDNDQNIKSCEVKFESLDMEDGDTHEIILNVVNPGSRALMIRGLTLAHFGTSPHNDPPTFQMYVADPVQRTTLASGYTVALDPITDGKCNATELRVTVTYTHRDGYSPHAQLTFLTDANNAKEGTVVVTIRPIGDGPRVSVEPQEALFESVEMGKQYSKILTVQNIGTKELLIDHYNLSGDPGFLLHVGMNTYSMKGHIVGGHPFISPIQLGPGEKTSLTLAFQPAAGNAWNSSLTFYSNDLSKPDGLEIPIHGLVAGPCLKVTPLEVNFGIRNKNTTSSLPLLIEPCSSHPAGVEIYSIELANEQELSPFFQLDLSYLDELPSQQDPIYLMPGSKLKIPVNYHPTQYSPPSDEEGLEMDLGRIEIRSNGSKPVIQVNLSGACGPLECPKAIIDCAQGTEVVPQTLLQLNGTNSLPTAGDITKWQWSVTQPPLSNSVLFPSPNFSSPSFEANVAGVYEFHLDVWDSTGTKSCLPASYEVYVVPNEAIHVELLWHTPGDADESDTGPDAGSDLDLHFAHPWANQPDTDQDGLPDPWFDNLFDCFWFNTDPDWGNYQPGVNDNPGLDRDDVDGAGPENMNLAIPENNTTYRIGVHYWNEHGYGNAFATIRVYIYGLQVFEAAEVELMDQDLWDVASVEWPSGKVTAVVAPDGGPKITHGYANPYFYQ